MKPIDIHNAASSARVTWLPADQRFKIEVAESYLDNFDNEVKETSVVYEDEPNGVSARLRDLGLVSSVTQLAAIRAEFNNDPHQLAAERARAEAQAAQDRLTEKLNPPEREGRDDRGRFKAR